MARDAVQISGRQGITQMGMGSFIEDASHLLVLVCGALVNYLCCVQYHRSITFDVILGGDKACAE